MIFSYMRGPHGVGRVIPASVPEFAMGDFCPRPRPHWEKIPDRGAPNRVVPMGIPAMCGFLTSLDVSMHMKSRTDWRYSLLPILREKSDN